MEPENLPSTPAADDDETMIIGSPEDKGNVPGSERYSCLFCQGDSWIGPASQKILREGKAKVICIHCYLFNPKVKYSEEIRVSSRSELVAAFGSEEAADLVIKHGPKFFAALKKAKPALEPWKRS